MDAIKQKYFSNPKNVITLKKGELLLKQGEINHRLFLLESGRMEGFDPEDEGAYFQVSSGEFAGLNSFFTPEAVVQMSIKACEDCVLRYFEKDIFSANDEEGRHVACDFMPVVMRLLIQRQKQIQEANRERRHVLKEMKDVERLASLGQLSAGVAHELNNAITVIGRGSEQISKDVVENLRCAPIEKRMVNLGLEKGRVVSSTEARKVAKALTKSSPLSEDRLRDYARTGAGEALVKEDQDVAQRAYELWNLGATLYDLKLASHQAEHVISSMRSLASTNAVRQRGCDINESIQKAIFLLANAVKNVDLQLTLGEIPTVMGNSGELVQIWTNIIKNAIDALDGTPREKAKISVKTRGVANAVEVLIEDNGPGISKEMINEIFKPHVTTKKEGQTFGLGLGLTIVQKIIRRYAGELFVNSSENGTEFKVLIPMGEQG